MVTNTGRHRESPSIAVFYQPGLRDDFVLQELLWGVEEEGVPCYTREMQGFDVQTLGYEAARESRLGVGIGIGAEGEVVLHYHRLALGRPLFTIQTAGGQGSLCRKLGSNAARLVKGVPFQDLEPEPEADSRRRGIPAASVKENDGEELIRLIAGVIARVLAEQYASHG